MRKSLLLILFAVCLTACRKDKPLTVTQPVTPITPITPVTPPAYGLPVTVTIDQSQAGFQIPAMFEGLSFETRILSANPEFLNTSNAVVVQLIKNLGPGLLRIGGGTSDEVYWSENTRTSTTTPDSLTTSDIDRLAAFSKAVGWPVLFGLNLGAYDLNTAANEAVYVNNALGDNLYAFQSGNEPDVFNYGLRPTTYGFNDFQNDWESYFTAVRKKLPQVPFAGPDVAYNTNWVTSFAQTESGKVKFLDAHFYLTGPASNGSINYHYILDPSYKLAEFLSDVKGDADQHNLPYRVTESNNVYGGGKKDVSDVFAASLWALDVMWAIAANNGQGINFHDGFGLYYSPIDVESGGPIVGPEYYAMLAFKYGSTGGKVIPTTISNTQYCSAYACLTPDNSYSITLINKDEKNNYSFTLQLDKAVSSVQLATLTAPSVTSKTDITFAGATVNPDGTFQEKTIKNYTANGKTVVVNMQAGSAAVLTVK